jgi:hypothetical protein
MIFRVIRECSGNRRLQGLCPPPKRRFRSMERGDRVEEGQRARYDDELIPTHNIPGLWVANRDVFRHPMPRIRTKRVILDRHIPEDDNGTIIAQDMASFSRILTKRGGYGIILTTNVPLCTTRAK